MTQSECQIRQLADELQPPDSGKQSIVLLDDGNTKVVLFAFAAGSGLTELVAPFPAIIQIIKREAGLPDGFERISSSDGTHLLGNRWGCLHPLGGMVLPHAGQNINGRGLYASAGVRTI